MAFEWNNKQIKTIGELFTAINSVTTKEEAQKFTKAYLAVNEHAIANIGYVSRYADDETYNRIRGLFNAAHPIFG